MAMKLPNTPPAGDLVILKRIEDQHNPTPRPNVRRILLSLNVNPSLLLRLVLLEDESQKTGKLFSQNSSLHPKDTIVLIN